MIKHRTIITLSIVLLGIFSCTDEVNFPLPKPMTYKYIVSHNASPILEFLFTQRLGEKKDENKTLLRIQNITNYDIENLRFIVSAFKAKERISENYGYIYASTIEKIASGDTSKTFIINTSSDLALKEGLVEVGIISIGRDNMFSNIYQGSFKAYSAGDYTPLNLVTTNVTNGYITSDGFVNIKIPGSTATKIIQGHIDEEGNFYGEALRADGTLLSKLIHTKEATIVDSLLYLDIKFLESSNTDNIKSMTLTLSPI